MSRLRIRVWGEYDRRGKNGFTLVELLVVIVILGILAAIAIPTMLGQRGKSQDAAAINALRSIIDDTDALKGETTGNWSSFTTSTCSGSTQTDFCAAMQAAEPTYTFVQYSASTGPANIAVYWDPGGNILFFQNKSQSGRYYCEYVYYNNSPGHGKSTVWDWNYGTPLGCPNNAASNAGW